MRKVEVGFGLRDLANLLWQAGFLRDPEDYVESISVTQGYTTPSGKEMSTFISLTLMEKE